MRYALAVLLIATNASAQPSPEATKLFDEGRELAKQDKWVEACDKFQKSLGLDPTATGTKLNIGDCLEKQGQVRKGWLMYEEAARDWDKAGDSRAKFAHDRANQAAAKLATVVIKIAQPATEGLAIRIGDRPASPQAEIVERVDPGSVQIQVSAPNKETFSKKLEAGAGKTLVVDVPELGESRAERIEEPTKPDPLPMPPVENPRRTRVTTAIVLGGVGAVSLITSGVFALLANSQYDGAFDPGKAEGCVKTPDGPVCGPAGKSEIESAGTKADFSTGFAVVGIGFVAAGIIVYVTAPKERTGIAVAPIASPTSAGVTMHLNF